MRVEGQELTKRWEPVGLACLGEGVHARLGQGRERRLVAVGGHCGAEGEHRHMSGISCSWTICKA